MYEATASREHAVLLKETVNNRMHPVERKGHAPWQIVIRIITGREAPFATMVGAKTPERMHVVSVGMAMVGKGLVPLTNTSMIIRFAGDRVAHNTFFIRGLEKKHSAIGKDQLVIIVNVISVARREGT